MFREQDDAEKRELVRFFLANSTWRDGKLTATLPPPFDELAQQAERIRSSNGGLSRGARSGRRFNSSNGANPNTNQGSDGLLRVKNEIWSG